jgi:glycosyltransferase 2 family protein
VAAGGWQNGLALLGVLPLALLWPRWLNPLLGRLERRKASELGLEIEAAAAPPIRGYPWPPLLGQLLFVLLRFGGFACCVQAYDLSYSLNWGGWLAGFALAWTAGLVVPGAPGGLGVFEAALLLRLGFAIPEAPLLAIAISYRLVVTLADLLAALTARLDGPRQKAVSATAP